jgi:hypothetical protein
VWDERVRSGAAETLVATSYLVAGTILATTFGRVESFPQRWRELRFVLSGPWPPYGFAE